MLVAFFDLGGPVPRLSVVVITLEAASQLPECLASVGFADEILVVDAGSSDGTRDIARSLGARVIEQPWMGFARQKQFAVDQAENDWVLSIDADERVAPPLADSIRAALAEPRFAAFRLARRNRFMGCWLAHGEGYPDWCLRLFDRRRGRFSDDVVHERVLVDGVVGDLSGDLLHESVESLERYLAKQGRYSNLLAESQFAKGHRANWLRMVGSPVVRFLRFYFLRRGFLDGVPGLVHIAVGCFASFMKYARLLELEREKR